MTTHAQALFVQALEMEPAAREAFFTAACGDDVELRLAVQRLLMDAARADSFFGNDDGATPTRKASSTATSSRPT